MNIQAVSAVTPWGTPTGAQKSTAERSHYQRLASQRWGGSGPETMAGLESPVDRTAIAKATQWVSLDRGKRFRLKWLLLRGGEPWSPSSALRPHSVGMVSHGGFSLGASQTSLCAQLTLAADKGGGSGETGQQPPVNRPRGAGGVSTETCTVPSV